MIISKINFPEYTGTRCLMMPYIQGDSSSVPEEYQKYSNILDSLYFKKGDIGYLTIDESAVKAGTPHRGARAKHSRALHTEAGKIPEGLYAWGGGTWGSNVNVLLDKDVEIFLANNLEGSCAVWNACHEDTTLDGDIGHLAHVYPYENARFLKAGEVARVGIFTPHESIPVKEDINRQFIRIVSSGVHGREPYFTKNPILTFLH